MLAAVSVLLHLVFALGFPAEAKDSRIDSAFESCFDEDWSKRSCEFIDLDDPREAGAQTGQPAFVERLAELVIKGTVAATRVLKGPTDCLHSDCHEAADAFRAKLGELKTYLAGKRISKCQKACLVKCISSKLLSYRENPAMKMSSLDTLVSVGEGVCTEFARLNDHIAESVGLPSSVTFSLVNRHAYVQQRIDGVWYYSEPQSASCFFFYSKSGSETLKRGLGEIQGP